MKSKGNNLIFIVEDDVLFTKILSYHVSLNPDYEIETFATGKECIENLYKNPMAITLDYSLPDMTGLDTLKRIKSQNPDVPVIIISGQEDIATAINLLKEGAYDYIVKGTDTRERLWNLLKNIKENQELRNEITLLRKEVQKKYEFSNIIKGNSPGLKRVFDMMDKAAQTNINVSITGETGTGKELVAKAIHYKSIFSKGPFVVVNVSAIPKELIESEMFGHEKGAFTGAVARRIGKFEEANNGTIFLDEIGEMDMVMQTKLLRVIQEREITRVGGNSVIKFDSRIIVATHKNLQEEVKKGNFREDLYYRLLGLPIELPPLRERGNDILLLARHFADEFCKENELKKVQFSQQANEKLLKYHWPGNIRELKAVIELACVLNSSGEIQEEEIQFRSANNTEESFLNNKEMTLEEYNRQIIKSYLKKYDDNIVLVAEKLGVGRSTLYRMRQAGEI